MTPNNNQKKQNGYFIATNGGKNAPKQIHVAHRRSQSELTNLMIEQFTLQRQLEMVQVQQQHLLAQQQHLAQQASQLSNQNPFVPQLHPNTYYSSSPNNLGGNSPKYNKYRSNGSGAHSRNNSGFNYNNNNGNNNLAGNGNVVPTINVQDTNGNHKQPNNGHKKTGSQSSTYGHSRRHSIGLNEAKKAAAEEQAKRSASDHSPSFKFPPSHNTPTKAPPVEISVDTRDTKKNNSNNDNNDNDNFKFPPPPVLKNDDNDEFIKTPTSYHHSKSRTNSTFSASSQLSPFRHKQNISRDYNSFSPLEPPAMFHPGHRNRPSGSSVHSFNSVSNSQNQRKALFAPYLPQANIPDLIQEGRLVAGVLRVNKKNRSDAWVSTDGVLDADIYICGSKDRNRALEGDLVAVELLVVDDVWESKKEKEEKKRRKDASIQHDIIPLNGNDDYHNDASTTTATNSNDESVLYSPITPKVGSGSGNISPSVSDSDGQSPLNPSIKRRGSLKQRPTQKKNDDVEVEGQSLLLVEEEEISDDFKPLYAGHVVAVLDRIPGQLFSGTLGLLRPSQQAHNENNKSSHPPKIVWFKPTDKKVPLIAIPTELAPKDFVENADKYSNKVFVAALKRWPITSLHPFGVIVTELGEINDPKTEINSILRDKNFLSNEYSEASNPEKERAIFQPVPISKKSMSQRISVNDGTTTITAISQDGELSDFAFHVKEISSENAIELGCHVVDVTSYIEEGSSLDRRARKRSSSVFMPQKRVNLLPKALNSALKFETDKECATLSVIYKLDAETFQIKSKWIGATALTPSEVLTTELVDQILATNSSRSITLLHDIARNVYSHRIGMPNANLLPVLSLLESLDDEKTKVDLNIFDRSLGFAIINEIQRLANSSVAEHISEKLGDKAFLRKEAAPVPNKLVSLKNKIEKLGYDMDFSSSISMIRSILSIEDPSARAGIEILLYKSMPRAKYYVAGKVDLTQYSEFYSNSPLYTHFTAPLRRYADHVVHRQLKASLNGDSFDEDLDSLKITSEYCNFKKDCASEAQAQAIHLLLCNTVNDMGNVTGQLLTVATVLQVYESSFDVFIPELGIEKRVHGDQLPLIKAEFDSSNKVLELYWQAGVDSATFIPNDEKNPKSYRSSIKNKFRSTTEEIAKIEFDAQQNKSSLISEKMGAQLKELKLVEPVLKLPQFDENESALSSFIKITNTKKENDHFVQEIREMDQVPVLVRAEIGMALPCLTICALNPFLKRE